MSYFKDIDTWLDELLAPLVAGDAGMREVKEEIKDKLLESYRNGQAAAEPRDNHEAPEGNQGEPAGSERARWRRPPHRAH